MGKRKYAPPGQLCEGGCGLEVGGFTLGLDAEGRQTYTQKVEHSTNNYGADVWSGGLTHIMGGMRCRADEPAPREAAV